MWSWCGQVSSATEADIDRHTGVFREAVRALPPQLKAAVVVGDLATDNDAQRLACFGFPVQQITTGGTCHLNAKMIETALAAD